MVKTIVPILSILIFSCGFLDNKSETLSLKRVENTSDRIRLDGYYFRNRDNDVEIYFLYSNGLIQHMGSFNANSHYANLLMNKEFLRKVGNLRVSWGLYQVHADSITFERWYDGGGFEKIAYARRGVIVNDSTFRIGRIVRVGSREFEDVHELYHFKKFHPKPDSTNEFIK
jgi:hypothetical protein